MFYKDTDPEVVLEIEVQKAFWSVAKQYPDLDIYVHSMEWIDDCGNECDNICLNVCFGPKGWEDNCFVKDNDKMESELRSKIELALWEVVKKHPDMEIFINVFDFITRTGENCKDLACYLECNLKEVNEENLSK
jgi:hypothetical protein